MSSGLWVLVGVIIAATAFGVYRRLTDGRIRGAETSGHPMAETQHRLTPNDLGEPLGERATLVQFSTSLCQPCRVARRVLAEVAVKSEGVTHVEIDAEQHLDLVRKLDVMRTPTVVVLDPSGVVRFRAVGVPKASDLIAVLPQ